MFDPAITPTAARLGRAGASFVGDLRKWKRERKTTDDVLRHALATELCRGDRDNPTVKGLAGDIVKRFWGPEAEASRWSKVKQRGKAARGLLTAEQVDWPDWREELRETIERCVTDREIEAVRKSISCVEAPLSAAEMAKKFPDHFLEELSDDERRNDYRVALRWRLVRADELQAIGEVDRTAPGLRVGVAALASAGAGIITTTNIAGTSLQEAGIVAALTSIGVLLATSAERVAATRRRRAVQVRRFAARWSEDLSVALSRGDRERVMCLRQDLSERLIARAEESDDDDVVAALLEVEDVLSLCGGDPPRAAIEGAMTELSKALLPKPETEEQKQLPAGDEAPAEISPAKP